MSLPYLLSQTEPVCQFVRVPHLWTEAEVKPTLPPLLTPSTSRWKCFAQIEGRKWRSVEEANESKAQLGMVATSPFVAESHCLLFRKVFKTSYPSVCPPVILAWSTSARCQSSSVSMSCTLQCGIEYPFAFERIGSRSSHEVVLPQ